MIISIASGKGGTGKTTVAINLALSLSGVQFLDCDVEEPNAHIFLKPNIIEKKPVYIPVPHVDESKCNFCGVCQEVCQYNAIAVLKNKVLIFKELCHGCGGCKLLCPQTAIEEIGKEIGVVEFGESNGIQFIHGKLNIGEAMSPHLIRAVKSHINPTRVVIIDAPPGTSCPVIEAIKDSNYCILVTEPTPFGLNDLILAVEVVKKLEIPHGVIINRANIGDEKVETFCKENKIPILAKIPFDKKIAKAYSQGEPFIFEAPQYVERFQKLFEEIIYS
jgi:MinD superfamily P-loop ATPase